MSRNGPPLSRHRETSDDHLVIVGEPSLLVSRDDVRAYAARVDAQLKKMDALVNDWFFEREGEAKAWTSDEESFQADWNDFKTQWFSWKGTIDRFDLLGPSPSAAWQQTQIYETRLEELRQDFAVLTQSTQTKAPPAPGPLEPAGGVTQPGIGDVVPNIAGAVTPLLLGAVAVVVGVVLLTRGGG